MKITFKTCTFVDKWLTNPGLKIQSKNTYHFIRWISHEFLFMLAIFISVISNSSFSIQFHMNKYSYIKACTNRLNRLDNPLNLTSHPIILYLFGRNRKLFHDLHLNDDENHEQKKIKLLCIWSIIDTNQIQTFLDRLAIWSGKNPTKKK